MACCPRWSSKELLQQHAGPSGQQGAPAAVCWPKEPSKKAPAAECQPKWSSKEGVAAECLPKYSHGSALGFDVGVLAQVVLWHCHHETLKPALVQAR